MLARAAPWVIRTLWRINLNSRRLRLDVCQYQCLPCRGKALSSDPDRRAAAPPAWITVEGRVRCIRSRLLIWPYAGASTRCGRRYASVRQGMRHYGATSARRPRIHNKLDCLQACCAHSPNLKATVSRPSSLSIRKARSHSRFLAAGLVKQFRQIK